MAQLRSRRLLGRCIAVVVLAAAMGYIEAAVVVYLRELLVPLREVHFPEAVGEPLPLLTVEQLEEGGQSYPKLLGVEVAREIAPIAVLLAVAWGLARRRGECLAFFLVGFAVWDVFYYVFLKLLLGWPASLGTWDVLYLIPTAWVAPVWAPLMVSGTMLVMGLIVLLSRREFRVGRVSLGAWLAMLSGVGLVLASFLARRSEAFGAVPEKFDSLLFLAGWALAVVGLLWARRAPKRHRV